MTVQRHSVVPALIDALVARFTALLPGTPDQPVTVCDGYSLTNNPGDYVYVGVDTNPLADAPGPAVTIEQDFASLSARDRDESGSIGCAVDVVDGGRDGAQKRARDRAFELLGVIEDELRANPTLGVPGVLHVRIGNPVYTQGIASGGVVALIAFPLVYKARI